MPYEKITVYGGGETAHKPLPAQSGNTVCEKAAYTGKPRAKTPTDPTEKAGLASPKSAAGRPRVEIYKKIVEISTEL